MTVHCRVCIGFCHVSFSYFLPWLFIPLPWVVHGHKMSKLAILFEQCITFFLLRCHICWSPWQIHLYWHDKFTYNALANLPILTRQIYLYSGGGSGGLSQHQPTNHASLSSNQFTSASFYLGLQVTPLLNSRGQDVSNSKNISLAGAAYWKPRRIERVNRRAPSEMRCIALMRCVYLSQIPQTGTAVTCTCRGGVNN